VPCETGSDCSDGLDCTLDVCTEGECSNMPDDGMCTASSGGVCDPTDGCQYPTCTSETCTAGPCQTAECVGDRCERTNLCSRSEMCCNDMCVPAGCDDGHPCTDDSCGSGGCEHVPNDDSCDDGTFCNGADTCSGGSCSDHAGDPCSGSAVCDETADVCTGCVDDGDCGDPVYGSWGSCSGFSGTCDESGTRTRTVTTYACESGTCVGTDSTDTGSCSRDTDGTTCSPTSCDAWSSCDYGGTCDESASRSRTCMDHVCSAGSCSSSSRTETGSCSRDTDGDSCGASSCGSWSGCSGFTSTCDESGTRSRSCTDRVCSGGSCTDDAYTDAGSCSRDTDGDDCGTSCGPWGTCGMFTTICDETGTRTRSCTARMCSSGSCMDSGSYTDMDSCSRDTDGDPCDDRDMCTWGDHCSGGICTYSGMMPCGPDCVCNPSTGACESITDPMGLCVD